MAINKIGVFAFGLILIGALTPASAHDDADTATAAIEKLLTGFAAAVASSDVDAMAGYIDTSEAFSVIEGRHANWGWRDYRDNHLVPEFSSPDFKILDFTIADIRVQHGDKFAYAVYQYHITMEVKGERKERTAFETVVLVRTEEGWKIRHMHS